MGEPWVEMLYQRFGPSVFRRARTLLGSDDAAWDVVQEIFVRALRSRDGFRNEASPTTWLYRMTTNYCFNVIRDGTRRRRRLAQQTMLARAEPSAVEPAAETRVMLAEILERIPAELCEVAVYFYVDRMSQDEIAATLGRSRKTVGNRLREFRARVRAIVNLEREAFA